MSTDAESEAWTKAVVEAPGLRRRVKELEAQAAEREALLARGAELLGQDAKEIEELRAELTATKREAEHRAWREGAHHGRQLPMNTWTELMDSNPYPDPKREPCLSG